jgi:hypothetical protein
MSSGRILAMGCRRQLTPRAVQTPVDVPASVGSGLWFRYDRLLGLPWHVRVNLTAPVELCLR